MITIKLWILLASVAAIYSEQPSPLYMSGNHPLITQNLPFPGPMDPHEFYTQYTEPLLKNKVEILLVLEKVLEISDLLPADKAPEPFFNVKNMMKKSKYSSFFLQVERPLEAFINNKTITGKITSKSFDNWTDFQYGGVHVIKMGYNPYERIYSLKVHDRIIYKACREFAQIYPSYACVLTGLSGDLEKEDVRSPMIEEVLVRKVRAVPTESAAKNLALNAYYHPDLALIYTKTPPTLTVSQPTEATYELSKTSAITIQQKDFVVKLQDTSNTDTLPFRLSFQFAETSGGTWSLNGIELMNTKNTEKELLTPNIKISSSIGYSFHTPSKVVFSGTNNKLVFNTLQVQYFNTPGHPQTFDVADDTVYFFTIPILSGIFVTSLLITIVLLGLSMIFDIKTMDLFDDPKGKTVTINASE